MPVPPPRVQPADTTVPPRRRQILIPLLRRCGLPETPGRCGAAAASLKHPADTPLLLRWLLCRIRSASKAQSPLPACVAGTAEAGSGGDGDAVIILQSMHGVAYNEDSFGRLRELLVRILIALH